MKKDILSLTLSALCVLSACSNDDEEWRSRWAPALNDTEWIRVGAVYDAAESFSPIRFPKEQTLSFGENDFTMTTQGSIHDEKSDSMRDTTIITRGSYTYEHPTLRMTPEAGLPTVEAWISPQNRICFYDSKDFCEFQRK